DGAAERDQCAQERREEITEGRVRWPSRNLIAATKAGEESLTALQASSFSGRRRSASADAPDLVEERAPGTNSFPCITSSSAPAPDLERTPVVLGCAFVASRSVSGGLSTAAEAFPCCKACT